MLTNIVYALGVILVILGIIGIIGISTGVGVTGLVVGIVLIVVAKFVLSGRSARV